MEHVAGPEHRGMNNAQYRQHREPPQVQPGSPRGIALEHPTVLEGETDAEQKTEHAVELAREQHVPHALRPLVDRARPQVRAVGLGEERLAEARHVHDEDAEQREAAKDVERRDPLGDRNAFDGASRHTTSPRGSRRRRVARYCAPPAVNATTDARPGRAPGRQRAVPLCARCVLFSNRERLLHHRSHACARRDTSPERLLRCVDRLLCGNGDGFCGSKVPVG